ncbi:hypothetical protein BDF20DRAFT_921594 [Mycotypha africana]|uniref:uncharacterized protein n=1 Tax=Mycotypha africana TaxID=64632 RepID=UPI0023018013|nr:uncharacterized protein BDF20DRAFT_921594 [Mycotypha africana]KAI8991975.1 hypothetical protein BDF20DRAFT_921594 [Mycotypha africana]
MRERALLLPSKFLFLSQSSPEGALLTQLMPLIQENSNRSFYAFLCTFSTWSYYNNLADRKRLRQTIRIYRPNNSNKLRNAKEEH